MEENKEQGRISETELEQVKGTPNEASGWFCDDFEARLKQTVPNRRALSVYKPPKKKLRRLLHSPVLAGILSSLVTCCLCLGIFAAVYRPPANESVLPPAGAALRSRVESGGLVKIAAGAAGRILGIPEIYDLASPAVVSILCKSQGGSYVQSQMSSGSGIILRPDGYLVTNNHVVEGASEITVTTIAGQTEPAKIIGRDSRTDLAVLKIESEQPLPFAELGDSAELRVGDMALAIGNPLRDELAGTLTVGYISAINRSMVIDGKQMTMLQTDAAINPGNSGGALLNRRGQVIGINTAKSTGYDVEGLGFAIPINEAKPVIESIIRHGYVTGRVVIGLKGQDITEAIAEAYNLPKGVYIREIFDGSAAEKAGLRVGDVILSCDGQTVETVDEINKIRDKHKAGDSLSIKLDRNGQELTIRLTLQEEKPSEDKPAAKADKGAPDKQPHRVFPQEPSEDWPLPHGLPFPFSLFGW